MPEAASTNCLPLVVDLDGTLTTTDTLIESVLLLIRLRPWMLLALPLWLLQGKSRFKARIAYNCRLPVSTLPWRTDLLEWLELQRSTGRKIVLATAAHQQIANDVAETLSLFDAVIASDNAHNRKGLAKLAAIRATLGDRFVYAGDSTADLAIWNQATAAVLVGVTRAVRIQVNSRGIIVEHEFFGRDKRGSLTTWLKAIRIHQWAKNILLFVPLLTSFSFYEPTRVAAALVAFFAFCASASGTYLLNDLWDLENDRQHATKRLRPFASGSLPLLHGILASAALVIIGLTVAGQVSTTFLSMAAGYVVFTTVYSWVLKRYVILDVLSLAILYAYRVLAGAVAIGVNLSPWLLAFSVFTFLSLALVKRCAELVAIRDKGQLVAYGRDYRVSDLAVLWPLGVGAGLCAVVVFGLFVGSTNAQQQYGSSTLLWFVSLGLIYWLARMWIKTARGEMNDDPVLFALKDRGSALALGAMAIIPIMAHAIR